MKKTNLFLVLILITALVFTGCSGNNSDEPEEKETS